MKYNFVLIGNCNLYNLWGIFYYIYKDVNNYDYSMISNFYSKNRLLALINRIHFSEKVKVYVKLPFQKLWLKNRVNHIKKSIYKKLSGNICFVLLPDCITYEKYGFSNILREFFNNAKIVYFFQDLVAKDSYKKWLLQNRSIADLIYTYDIDDANKYNLLFHNVPYSNLSNLFQNKDQKYDLCFIGQAKDRLKDIIEAYKYFSSQNLKCGFFIAGVSLKDRVLDNKINYINQISYEECLEIVIQSKCLLEIVQGESQGNTIRVYEAITFDKLLISNNKYLASNPAYNEKFMKIYSDLKELDAYSFINSTNDVLYDNKELIRPSAFFRQIEKDLDRLT